METNEENEYRNKLNALANTLSEKMAILEARDRLMRLKRLRQTDLATAVAVVGTCPDMCPELERYFRSETNQMSSFELTDDGQPDEHRMIKEYRRSGADQEEPLAHELRPTPVLNRTMDYLCTNIMDTNASCGEWYDFVWSRTRSIRKDITQQHLCDEQSVALTEKCARFHIHCSATLCEEDVKDFDPKINEENLSNCLQSLRDLYYDLSLRDIHCENEPEFRSYEILLHLNDTAILRDVQNYRRSIRESSPVRFAIRAFFAYQSNNYIQFFELVSQCSYLMACVLHRYFTPVRQRAFKILRKSYTTKASVIQEYSADALVNSLGFESTTELKQFCDHIGLECTDQVVYLIRGHNQNNAIKAKRSLRLVENKCNTSVGQVVNGQPLPANPYKSVPVHHSFDSEGRLREEAFEALDQRTKSKGLAHSRIGSFADESAKPVFGTTIISKPSLIGESLFLNAPSFFTRQTNVANSWPNRYSKPETNANAFSLPANNSGFRFGVNSDTVQTQSSSSQNNAFISETLELKSNSLSNQKDVNIVPIHAIKTENDSNIEIIEKLLESIANEMIESVAKQSVNEICDEVLQKIRILELWEKTISQLFSDIFIETVHNFIKEVSNDVIREEMDIRIKQKKRIEKVSNDLCNDLYDNCIDSEIRTTSEEVLNTSRDQYIEKQNILIANAILNDLIDGLVEESASGAYMNASEVREAMVRLMRAKKLKRLEEKYLNKWKNWFCKRKLLKHLKQSFPAAPNWQSNGSTTKPLEFGCFQHSLDDNFLKTIERELLANFFLNNSIDLLVKEIASDVIELSGTERERLFELFKQKRVKRLQTKYLKIWKTKCFEKRRKDRLRTTFPAAPDWRSSEAISSRMKYSFSDLGTDFKISPKRMRRESEEKTKEETNGSNSSRNLRQLLATEMSESKAFTQKLNESLNEFNSSAFQQSFDETVNELNVRISANEEEYESEEEMDVIVVYETQEDKMNRLKRLLSEEKDYFSLQNFVQYLSANDYNEESNQLTD